MRVGVRLIDPKRDRPTLAIILAVARDIDKLICHGAPSETNFFSQLFDLEPHGSPAGAGPEPHPALGYAVISHFVKLTHRSGAGVSALPPANLAMLNRFTNERRDCVQADVGFVNRRIVRFLAELSGQLDLLAKLVNTLAMTCASSA